MSAEGAAMWRSVERNAAVTPLGIRFWDPAFDTQISGGISATAYPDGGRWPATRAFVTRGGIYAFHGLPGLHDAEYPPGDPAGPSSLPPIGRFLIEVRDAEARFLPVCFYVDVPFDGIYPTDLPQGPNAALPGFYLFSAPTRPGSPLLAMVRAQLAERLSADQVGPAANAVIEIGTPDGATWVTLTDARGVGALPFPYPAFGSRGGGSLPSNGPQNWPLTVRVRYQPSALDFPAGSTVPELKSVLTQGYATIWTERLAPPGQTLSELPATLVFAQELVLRSEQESTLLISVGSLP